MLSPRVAGLAIYEGYELADPAALQIRPQPGVAARDLVRGHPPGRDVGVQRAGDHLPGRRRLGHTPTSAGTVCRVVLADARLLPNGRGQVGTATSTSMRPGTTFDLWLAY